jgi:putative membrane protein
MSESDTAPRRPRAFRLTPAALTAPDGPEPEVRVSGAAEIVATADPFAGGTDAPLPPAVTPDTKKPSWIARIFWSALSGLVSLAVGLWAWKLVEELFTMHPAVGWIGAALAALALAALLALVVREVMSLRRMGRMAAIREQAEEAVRTDSGAKAKAAVSALVALTARDARFAAARAEVEPHLARIVDGRGLVGIAERAFLARRDEEAKAAIASAAERVSVVTAISPRAIVDVLFVAAQSVMLVRKIAGIYGGRPGTAGFLRIGRNILGHLALTGGLAITDSVLSQLVGHGMAARLSAKLGEGVLNGLLSARVGLAAIAACRPLPFTDLPEPKLQDVAGKVLSGRFGQARET